MPAEQSRLGWDQDKPLKRGENAQCQTRGATPCANLVSWPGDPSLDPSEVVSVELTCAAAHTHGYWAISDAVGWNKPNPLERMGATRCKRRLDNGILCVSEVLFTSEKARGDALAVGNAPDPGTTMAVALTCGDHHTEWYFGVKPFEEKPDEAKPGA